MVRYLLTNGVGGYIRFDEGSNRYVQVKGKKFAHDFKSEAKANQQLKSAKKRYGTAYHLEVDDDGVNESAVETALKKFESFQNEANPEAVKEIAEQEVKSADMDDVKEKIALFKSMCKTASERASALSAQLSISDSEISDIEHYIELTDVPDEQCVDIVKMLKTVLKQRRAIKDEHMILMQLGGCSLDPSTITEVEKAAENLKTRRYTPKVLKELFKGGELVEAE